MRTPFCLRKKRTITKFTGTQMANMGKGARVLLRPKRRKRLRTANCNSQFTVCDRANPAPRFTVRSTRKVKRVLAKKLNTKLTP